MDQLAERPSLDRRVAATRSVSEGSRGCPIRLGVCNLEKVIYGIWISWNRPTRPNQLLHHQNMKTYYCWKCQANLPFLDEEEWKQVSPFLVDAIQAIKTIVQKRTATWLRRERPANLKLQRNSLTLLVWMVCTSTSSAITDLSIGARNARSAAAYFGLPRRPFAQIAGAKET